MAATDDLRTHLLKALDWHDAHVDFDAAVRDLPVHLQGSTPPEMPFSPWQLVEHMRIAQHDIFDFCRNPKYEEMKWPDDYWPKSPAPPDPRSWSQSLEAFRRDRDEWKKFVADPTLDLYAKIPHGTGQTYLREVLLVIDHNAYHLGQLVAVRRQLGAWTP